MEPETSTAIPARSGGVGELRRRVAVNGSAVGTDPLARWASRARAARMLRRPGGVGLVVRSSVRSR